MKKYRFLLYLFFIFYYLLFISTPAYFKIVYDIFQFSKLCSNETLPGHKSSSFLQYFASEVSTFHLVDSERKKNVFYRFNLLYSREVNSKL